MPLMITQVQGGQLALCDSSGNILGIIDDSGTKRLAVDAKFTVAPDVNLQKWLGSTSPTVGQKAMSASVPVALASDQSTVPVAIISSAVTPVNLVADYLKNGSAYNMKVNGSVTPVVFTYAADATKDIRIVELRFIFGTLSFDWSGAGFGKAAAATLTNGILIQLTVNNGTVTTLNTIKINEDFLRMFGEAPVISQAGANDIMVSSYRFSETTLLKAGTADKIQVTVRDNLTGGSLGVNYLTATFFGHKVISCQSLLEVVISPSTCK